MIFVFQDECRLCLSTVTSVHVQDPRPPTKKKILEKPIQVRVCLCSTRKRQRAQVQPLPL